MHRRCLHLTAWSSGANLSDAAVNLPSPAPGGAGATLDGGDKWVEVVRRQHCPDVVVFANMLTAAECDALILAAKPRLSRSLTVDTNTGDEALHSDRTSQGMFFERFESDLVSRIEARIAKLLRWPVKHGEGLQVLRYQKGAQYAPHYDYFDVRDAATPALLARGGQRVATLIMYLKEPDSGGATVFPDLGLDIQPKRGQAVFFSYPQARPSSLSLHGGAPVVAGEKWIATKWLRQREFA